ncbi:M23 family metallopeptidase [Streptomyces sp. NPDC018031]|uniref:M23 family metallopeptidase n=1 Tax=Streptomyces sp. NPDC018031 TaxID=3365033 RepID=UPI00379DFC3B
MSNPFVPLYRCCWAVFFAYAVAGAVFDLPWLWGWFPLGAAMLLQVLAERRRAAAERTAPDPASIPVAEGGAAPGPAAPREPVEVLAPVTGRWSAMNSPADRVPSHGTYVMGQSHAIDIVAEPADGSRPRFGWWPWMRRNRAFPAFDAPVLAVADATVVSARDTQRDHLSRNSVPALPYWFVEQLVRSLGGARRIVGNHVLLDLGDGVFAMYAHLRQGSLTVRPGDRVRAGQPIARCGNSGNTTEPHVHFQLMDSADLGVARGVPFVWRGVGVPANGEVFSALEPRLAGTGG